MTKRIIGISILILVLSAALCLVSCENPALYEGIDTHNHEFGEWSEDSATCTEPGARTRTCELCKETETVPTAAIGHDMIDYKDREPTCTEIGCVSYSACSRCEYYEGERIDAHGHEMTEWVVSTEATCTNEGFQDRMCTVCTETETQTIKHLGHAMVKHKDSEPTCTEEGYSNYKNCSRCDYFEGEKTDSLGHAPDENGECSRCHEPVTQQ